MSDLKDCADLAAATAAALSAFFSYLALRSFNTQTYANILVSCMENYMQVEKVKAEAIRKKSAALCKESLRELFDLTWREFNLWKMGCIPDTVMIPWLLGRRYQYQQEKLSIRNSRGKITTVEYKKVWQDRIAEGYFDPRSDFGRFMKEIHEGNKRVQDILRKFEKSRAGA